MSNCAGGTAAGVGLRTLGTLSRGRDCLKEWRLWQRVRQKPCGAKEGPLSVLIDIQPAPKRWHRNDVSRHDDEDVGSEKTD